MKQAQLIHFGFFFIVIFLLSIVRSVQAQELTPYQDGELWGYKNTSGVTVIEPKYIAADKFISGIALVTESKSYGYFIDANGNKIEPDKAQSKAYWHYINYSKLDNTYISAISKGAESLKEVANPATAVESNKVKGFKLNPNPVNEHNPYLYHNSNGLVFYPTFSLLSRIPDKNLDYKVSRMEQPFQFMSSGGDEYGFGYTFVWWLDGSSECNKIQYVSFLILNNGTVKVCDTTKPYVDGQGCYGYTCWLGKKKLEFHDLKNYSITKNYTVENNSSQTLLIIKYKGLIQFFINDELIYKSDVVDCTLEYFNMPIPFYYNKGNIKFNDGFEEILY